jgi:hypothetical protein
VVTAPSIAPTAPGRRERKRDREKGRYRQTERELMATVTSFGLGLSSCVNCEIKVSKCVHQDFLMDGIFFPPGL